MAAWTVPATFVGMLLFFIVAGTVTSRRQARRDAIERDQTRIGEERSWLAQNALPAVYTATYANTVEIDADLARLYSLGYEIEGGPTQDGSRQWVVTLARHRPVGTAPTI
jgi:hypothetical protein